MQLIARKGKEMREVAEMMMVMYKTEEKHKHWVRQNRVFDDEYMVDQALSLEGKMAGLKFKFNEMSGRRHFETIEN